MKNIEVSTLSTLDYIDVFLDPVIVIITFVLGFLLSNFQIKRKDKKIIMICLNTFRST
jgi:hypothetical protein